MASQQHERKPLFREDVAELEAVSLTKEEPLERPQYNYKPPILRTISLLVIFAITLAIIGVLEYARMRLPGMSAGLVSNKISLAQHDRRDVDFIYARSDSASVAVASSSSQPAETSATSAASAYVPETITASQSISPTAAATTEGSAYVSTAVSSTAASAYVSTAPGAEAPTAYVQSSVSETVIGTDASAAESAYVSTSYVSQEPTLQSVNSAYVQSTITFSLPSSVVTDTSGQTQTASEPVVGAAPTTAYVSVNSVGSTITLSTGPPTPQFNAVSATAYVSTIVLPASGSLPPTTLVITTTSSWLTYANSVPLTGSATPLPLPKQGQGANRQNSTGGSGNDNQVIYKLERNPFGPTQTFVASYLPVCLAVLYRMLWTGIFNAFQLIDPFMQLASASGGRGETTLFAPLVSTSSLLGPFFAWRKGRWALSMVTGAYVLVSFLPALASTAIFSSTNWHCPHPNVSNTNNPCLLKMFVDPVLTRMLQGLLAMAAVVIISLIFLLRYTSTGLLGDPSSIASVASMMRHRGLLEDMAKVPVTATNEDMKRMLGKKSYRLGFYTTEKGDMSYGVHSIGGFASDATPRSSWLKHKYSLIWDNQSQPQATPTKTSHRWMKDLLLLVVVGGLFGVVLAYYLVSGNNGFNRFFNSNTFGPRFILTGAGTVIAALWKSVEQRAMVMAPYHRLAKGPCPPKTTILFAPTSTPLASTFVALSNGYFAVVTITLVTLLGEACNVVMSGVPYAPGQFRIQFLISTYISLSILGIMIVVAISIAIARFQEPQIPRKPETLGAMMSYICCSRMLDDFEESEFLDPKARDRRVVMLRKNYEFKDLVRRDSKFGWAVDEVGYWPG